MATKIDTLPSSWLREPQHCNEFKGIRSRNVPAVDLVDTEDFVSAYGDFSSHYSFEFHPCTLSTFTTFAPSVREHHSSNEGVEHPTKAATAPFIHPRPRIVEARSRHPSTYAPSPVEDQLQFDFDAASESRVKYLVLSPEDLADKITGAG